MMLNLIFGLAVLLSLNTLIGAADYGEPCEPNPKYQTLVTKCDSSLNLKCGRRLLRCLCNLSPHNDEKMFYQDGVCKFGPSSFCNLSRHSVGCMKDFMCYNQGNKDDLGRKVGMCCKMVDGVCYFDASDRDNLLTEERDIIINYASASTSLVPEFGNQCSYDNWKEFVLPLNDAYSDYRSTGNKQLIFQLTKKLKDELRLDPTFISSICYYESFLTDNQDYQPRVCAENNTCACGSYRGSKYQFSQDKLQRMVTLKVETQLYYDAETKLCSRYKGELCFPYQADRLIEGTTCLSNFPCSKVDDICGGSPNIIFVEPDSSGTMKIEIESTLLLLSSLILGITYAI